MNVAFCINKLALVGLGVTVCSVIQNCSDTHHLRLCFLCGDLEDTDKKNITALLHKQDFKGFHQFIDFDAQANFGAFRSLHGDWTTYGRLLLPELLLTNRVLYLDADLVVEVDVLQLQAFDFAGKAIAAVHGGVLENELEHDFYLHKLRLPTNQRSFNAGILLFNLDLWRQENLKEKCLDVARRFPTELLSCDQALLNAVFSGNFAELPKTFNCAWLPYASKPETGEKMILHFVGSPKPWDVFGSLIHNGYATWQKYLDPFWAATYAALTLADWKRSWKIRKSYIRCLNLKLKRQTATVV